jgi:hypothetical protein
MEKQCVSSDLRSGYINNILTNFLLKRFKVQGRFLSRHYHKTSHFELWLKFAATFKFVTKLDKNNGHFMCRPTGISVPI